MTTKRINLLQSYAAGDVVLGRGCLYWHTGTETESDGGERYRTHIARTLYDDFPKHIYILAPSGAGKTTLMLSMIFQSARSGKPVSLVIIDGKNSNSFQDNLVRVAGACGKELVCPSRDGRGASHNPLTNSSDNPSEIVERLVDGFMLAEEMGADSSYYRTTEKRFYDTVIRCFRKHYEKEINFDELFWACRRQTAEKLFSEMLASGKLREKDKADLRDAFESVKEKDLAGAVTNLSPLAEMWQDGAAGTVDLYKELVNPNSILYFGFSATNPLSTDATLFRMLLRELMQLLHRKNSDAKHRHLQTRIFIDEFGVLKGETLAEAVALARESNTGFILAHQSFAQLDEFKRQIIFQNCATKILGKMSIEAEEISKHYGDRAIQRRGKSVTEVQSGKTVEGYSYAREMVFKVKPDVLRGLNPHEFIALNMNGAEVEARLFYSLLLGELEKNPPEIRFKSKWPTHWIYYVIALAVLCVSGILLGPERSYMQSFFRHWPTIPQLWFYWFFVPISCMVSILFAGFLPKAVSIIVISALSGAIVAGLRTNYHLHLALSWLVTIPILVVLIFIADWVAKNEKNKPGRPDVPN